MKISRIFLLGVTIFSQVSRAGAERETIENAKPGLSEYTEYNVGPVPPPAEGKRIACGETNARVAGKAYATYCLDDLKSCEANLKWLIDQKSLGDTHPKYLDFGHFHSTTPMTYTSPFKCGECSNVMTGGMEECKAKYRRYLEFGELTSDRYPWRVMYWRPAAGAKCEMKTDIVERVVETPNDPDPDPIQEEQPFFCFNVEAEVTLSQSCRVLDQCLHYSIVPNSAPALGDLPNSFELP